MFEKSQTKLLPPLVQTHEVYLGEGHMENLNSPLFLTSMDLSDMVRTQLVQLLNGCLADSVDLYTHAKHAYWNVNGSHFAAQQTLFDEMARNLQQHSDTIAERISTLGGPVNGTAAQIVGASNLWPYDLNAVTGEDHIRALARQLRAFAAHLRWVITASKRLEDSITVDVLIGMMGYINRDRWRLEGHQQTTKELGQREGRQIDVR